MWPGWTRKAFTSLPGTDDALFQNVWDDGLLLFDGKRGVGDAIDLHSARLVATAFRQGGRLLVTQPDFQPHRPAFLFATALIRHFLDVYSSDVATKLRSSTVLYFGPTIGIRDQLRRTHVKGYRLDLANVFEQQDILRGGTRVSSQTQSHKTIQLNLPKVITVYSPADPVGVLQAYRPRWIAVDCSDAPSLPWLKPLLNETARLEIPVVAWGQNPLSKCVNDFASSGNTFIWAPTTKLPDRPFRIIDCEIDIQQRYQDRINIEPIVLQGKSVDPFSNKQRQISQILAHASQYVSNKGRFERDAVAVHWKYYRSLESLAVPFDFYEVEATRLWGLQSFSKLSSVCEHFRAACQDIDDSLYRDLEEVSILLNDVKGCLVNQGCALWEALTNLCIEDPEEDEVRILVFTGESRKRLFNFAMLARHNTTEDDLREMKIYVASLNELRRWMHPRDKPSEDNGADDFLIPPVSAVWHPFIVGLPSPMITPRLLSAFLHPKIGIILYPYQCPAFMRRQIDWSVLMSGDTNRNIDTLADVSGIDAPTAPLPSYCRFSLGELLEMNIESAVKVKAMSTDSVWQPEDSVSEVSRLIYSDDESIDEELIINDQPVTGEDSSIDLIEDIWCAEAIRVKFDQGWHGYFAPDDMINVILRKGLDQRYIRSIRAEEQVLVIHGQQRQSLYELIISRVHRHPSIELHLALIRRWQEDLRIAYELWRLDSEEKDGFQRHDTRGLDDLLRQIQVQGSQLVSSLTLSLWLRGYVLCPLDPEDLRRISDVLEMRFVHQHYKRISQAARRLRGLHRGLSHKLNRWLVEQASGAIQDNDYDVIDSELGLTFGDIRSSLLVLRVKSVEIVTGPFLRNNLGRVEREM